jgi:hypothetical protein
MADAIRVANQGPDALRTMLPGRFQWPLFGLALALMSAPVLHLCRQIRWFETPRRANDGNRQGGPLGQPE